MSKWDLLREKCPRLFRHGIAFECGIGWYDLLEELCVQLEAIIEKAELNSIVPEGEEDYVSYLYAEQVKEKFGTLRFYMSAATNEIYALIDAAEAKSEVTCEDCGKPGKLNNDKWMRVRCNNCGDA